MVLKEDITPLVGGLDFDVIKQDTKKLVLGVRKLLHKTPESREKGVQLVKEAVASSPSLANSTFINNTLMNYIRENPVKSAGYVTAVATLTSIGIYGFNLAKRFIERWQWADNKAYNIIKHAQRPGSTPWLDYWYLMQHYLVKGKAAKNVFRTKMGYDLKRLRKLTPNDKEYENKGFNWRHLPLTLGTAGALGYLGYKMGLLKEKEQLPPHWQEHDTSRYQYFFHDPNGFVSYNQLLQKNN